MGKSTYAIHRGKKHDKYVIVYECCQIFLDWHRLTRDYTQIAIKGILTINCQRQIKTAKIRSPNILGIPLICFGNVKLNINIKIILKADIKPSRYTPTVLWIKVSILQQYGLLCWHKSTSTLNNYINPNLGDGTKSPTIMSSFTMNNISLLLFLFFWQMLQNNSSWKNPKSYLINGQVYQNILDRK
mmetsp:Transcript_46261/g.46954  ORF Transcript_46261/g.46954 Transcript_46261/m.46954 type:complete len:186 (+) Transcript_46261:2433-2990(+)